jgi:hypothetical protein
MALYFDLGPGDGIDFGPGGQMTITVVKKSGRAGRFKLRLKVETSDHEQATRRRSAERISAPQQQAGTICPA